MRTNGPASYFQIPGREQHIGFIGAMTNLHFCENCNKLRLRPTANYGPVLAAISKPTSSALFAPVPRMMNCASSSSTPWTGNQKSTTSA